MVCGTTTVGCEEILTKIKMAPLMERTKVKPKCKAGHTPKPAHVQISIVVEDDKHQKCSLLSHMQPIKV